MPILTDIEIKKLYEDVTTSKVGKQRIANKYGISLSSLNRYMNEYEKKNGLEHFKRPSYSDSLERFTKKYRTMTDEQKKEIKRGRPVVNKPKTPLMIDFTKVMCNSGDSDESDSDDEPITNQDDNYIEIDNKKIQLFGDQLIKNNRSILNKIKELTEKDNMTMDDVATLENLLIQSVNKKLLGDKFIKHLQDKYISYSDDSDDNHEATDKQESVRLICQVLPQSELLGFIEQGDDIVYSYLINRISDIKKGIKLNETDKIKFYIGIRHLNREKYIDEHDRVIRFVKNDLDNDYKAFCQKYKLAD